MGAKRAHGVTLRDVARVAGVSAQTVSCVINDNGSVSEDVRARVREIADSLGYRPNLSAKAMRTGRSKTIGLIISDIRSPFFPELAHEMQLATESAGYSILIVETNGSQDVVAQRISTLRSLGVDGVVSVEELPAVFDLRIPTVMLTETPRALDTVTADDDLGGTMLAEHLLAQGHRKIGLVTSPRKGCIPRRREGLLRRLEGQAEVVWEVWTPVDESVTPQIIDQCRKLNVTAVVCSHDLIAINLMRAMGQTGLSVPEDLSVVGFDDVQWASIVTPGLTTIRQPFHGLATEAVGLLLERIEKPKRRIRRVKLPVELIDRDSVAELPTPRGRRRSVTKSRDTRTIVRA